MAINNKQVGSSTSPLNQDDPGAVLPKLIDHNTTEEAFQEGMNDVAVQVNQTQIDVGYPANLTEGRVGTRTARTVDERLDTLENIIGIMDDDSGTQNTTADNTISFGGDPDSDITGSIGDLQISANAVGTDEIADDAVTSDKIDDETIVDGNVSMTAGIQRTKLETALQDFTITTGSTAAANPTNLGADFTIPAFSATTDGVVEMPTSSQVTGAGATDDLWVLGSDNNWYQLNGFVREGQQVPAAEISYTTTSHSTTAAVPAGMSIAAFIAVGANRVEGMPATQYGLENGDIVTVTNTTPTPDQTVAFVYIGNSLAAGSDGAASDFIQIGVAESFGFATDGAIEFAAGTRNLQLAATVPGTRTFSGPVTFSDVGSGTEFDGHVDINASVDLGDAVGDSITFNGRVDSDILPDANSTRALGAQAARWNVFADAVNANTYTGTITNTNIADDSVNVGKLSSAGTAGQIPTINDAADEVAWADPPIGIQMVRTLTPEATNGPTNVLVGTVVSLIVPEGNNVPGVYRAVTASGGTATTPNTMATWERLGTVNAIMTKTRQTTTAGTTAYTPGVSISPAHLITINGLTLVETIDYTVSANRLTFTLSSAVAAMQDIEVINFADIATIGAGEVNPNALGTGTLPTGVTVPSANVDGAVSQASSAPAAGFTIGNWTLAQDTNGNLTFSNGNTIRARLDTDGHFRTENDITAFDNL